MSSALPLHTSAVLHGAQDIQLEARTSWPPAPGEAQVAVMSTGLCGSDLHYYQHARNGDFVVRAPLVLGHEGAGIITALGPPLPHSPSSNSPLDASHPLNRPLRVGDRVALEAGIMCRSCSFCLSGRYNLCSKMRFCSSAKTFPHSDGTLQSKMNHPIALLHPLPQNLSFHLGSLAEPLSVILHATRRAALPRASTIAIFGAGTIGLLAASLVRSQPFSASRILMLDINQARLDYARNNGFVDDTFCLPLARREEAKEWSAEEKIQRARANIGKAFAHFGYSEGEGVDCVYECTGAEPCIQMGIFASRPGGRLLVIGMGSSNVNLPLLSAATREVDIVGVFRYVDTYPEALQLLSENEDLRMKAEKLVTHQFPLSRTTEAFELLGRGRGPQGEVVLKVMVGPAGVGERDVVE